MTRESMSNLCLLPFSSEMKGFGKLLWMYYAFVDSENEKDKTAGIAPRVRISISRHMALLFISLKSSQSQRKETSNFMCS